MMRVKINPIGFIIWCMVLFLTLLSFDLLWYQSLGITYLVGWMWYFVTEVVEMYCEIQNQLLD
jgi:hypothetical protein